MTRIRAAIKRAVITGYCRHWIPAWAVTVTFRALSMREL